MADNTHIEWTDTTWNVIRGCSRVSEGCRNCYAEGMSARFSGKDMPYEGVAEMVHGKPKWTNKIRLFPELLKKPKAWKRPRKIFVNSMSDTFHEGVPTEFVLKMFDVMREVKRHEFQILTKRAERMLELDAELDWPVNVWGGVSIESECCNKRAELLSETSAWAKFLSVEPLLGRIPQLHIDNIDWVIIGGESGINARPLELDWIYEIMEQCREKEVKVFVKQLGAVWSKENKSKDIKGGDMNDWPVGLRVRETFDYWI